MLKYFAAVFPRRTTPAVASLKRLKNIKRSK